MSIRLLGGRAKSFSLQVPAQGTRPTSVILRRKIFDSYQNLEDKAFIDCCAGSGAMGFEAWSRGSDAVTFLESSKPTFKTLKSNAQAFMKKFEIESKQIQLMPFDCVKWLDAQTLKNMGEFVLFFDPPYEDHQLYWNFLKKLNELGPLPGQLWLESDEQKGIKKEELTHMGLNPLRHYTHGTGYLCTIPLENGLNLSI